MGSAGRGVVSGAAGCAGAKRPAVQPSRAVSAGFFHGVSFARGVRMDQKDASNILIVRIDSYEAGVIGLLTRPCDKTQAAVVLAENFHGSSLFLDKPVFEHRMLGALRLATFLENLVNAHRDSHLNFRAGHSSDPPRGFPFRYYANSSMCVIRIVSSRLTGVAGPQAQTGNELFQR